MGLLTQTRDEYDYYVDNLKEAFYLIGQEAVLYEVSSETKDMYHDFDTLWKDGKPISVIFEDNPKPLLNKFNWLTEDDSMPYVCHVVAKSDEGEPLEIRMNMLICLKSQYGLVSDRLFRVSDVRGSSLNPLTWICKLVPYRFKADVDTSKPGYQPILDTKEDDKDFSFLKVKL